MNERIKELAEQCHHLYSEHNIDLEKFAELIVRECSSIAAKNQAEDMNRDISDIIKEHVGV